MWLSTFIVQFFNCINEFTSGVDRLHDSIHLLFDCINQYMTLFGSLLAGGAGLGPGAAPSQRWPWVPADPQAINYPTLQSIHRAMQLNKRLMKLVKHMATLPPSHLAT